MRAAGVWVGGVGAMALVVGLWPLEPSGRAEAAVFGAMAGTAVAAGLVGANLGWYAARGLERLRGRAG